jgi:hypothetical protein
VKLGALHGSDLRRWRDFRVLRRAVPFALVPRALAGFGLIAVTLMVTAVAMPLSLGTIQATSDYSLSVRGKAPYPRRLHYRDNLTVTLCRHIFGWSGRGR